ncbi:transketolase [Clostridium thermosuccinogenes]|uniref:Transketolase n=1 Tax=Clostridium thermosuccinogenes TaxID=84032 RepID=A0A2K2FQM2_9CLOT|nr:transketolase family protein [Pseudoclostridium thermosuccinogenes]AUS96007.1 transketolase [Pseudoclostridium thermosuccinogenes]PNT99396.1 transketolase [Pseudoclostridium thermosuccinogenes]PNU01083.1 transketolase [Pseudoclostridium thermosuccinogenes]
MKAIIAANKVKESIEMRKAYCDALMELAAKDDRIVALDADLMNSMGMMPFLKAFPDRAIDVGIQEANMIGVAAGLSATGKVPFAHSFGPFASRRCYDQIFLSCGYAKLNVKIIGSDPGITAAFNGGTHMPFEDMGILRNVPGITIMEPTDSMMLKDIIRQVADIYGVFYIRLLRKNALGIYEEGSTFEIGKGIQLRDGKDVTIFAMGYMVGESLKAADMLEKEGISARVVDMFTLKPIDVEMIVKCARETGAVVTAENHSIINGLGSAVAEVLAENCPTPMERIGSRDRFGQVGPVDYLAKEYNMTPEDIAEKCRKVITRKQGGC